MASALSVSNPHKICVKIRNPHPDGRTHTSLERARRFVASGRAYFDSVGQLVFTGRYVGRTRANVPVLDARDARPDAFPRRAVLPPSAEVLARMGTRGRYVPAAEALRAVLGRSVTDVRS